MNTSPDNEFIEVSAKWAPEVRRYRDYLEWLPSKVPTPFPAEAVESPSSGLDNIPDYPLWDDDEVIALANAATITATNYRRIMDAIIENGRIGEWISIRELSEWTGITYDKVANFRTQLYRWAHVHHKASAPFTGTWGPYAPKGKRVVLYRVSAGCAAQWERVRARFDELPSMQ